MYYDKLNKAGKHLAMRFASEVGLTGKVTTEHAPNGNKYAFFKLSQVVCGRDVDEVCSLMRQAGFEPDVVFVGAAMSTTGGFIGKAFSDKAKAE